MATAQTFTHPALFYSGPAEYLAGTVPFIRAGLVAHEPVAVAVPGPNLELLRDALGADAGRVVLRDMTVAGRNPGRIIPTVLLAFAQAHAGRRVRIIGEPIWAGRSAIEYPACAQHEALINAAFAGRAATILCPYDTGRLDPAWLRDAEKTHPVLRTGGREQTSPAYRDPIAVAGEFNEPLPAPPAGAARITVAPDRLAEIRRFVAEWAAAAGLRTARIGQLTLAVNELTSNTLAHTDRPGELALWVHDDMVAGQVCDHGYLRDPLAGRIPVAPTAPDGGRGLLLVHQLCDLVRVHTTPSGTTIRIHVHR